jgi:hypothetical protein
MSDVKAKMTEVIQAQPEDASYEEIIRELAFERMIERGMEDSRGERLIANDDMERRIRSWPKQDGPRKPAAGFGTSTTTSR